MVLYIIKNVNITLPSSGINSYIKIRKYILEKKQWGSSVKWKKIKNFLQCCIYRTLSLVQNPVFGIKIFTNNTKWCTKIDVKTNWNKNLIVKNKAYRKNIQLLRIMKERLPTYIPLGPSAPSKNWKRTKLIN